MRTERDADDSGARPDGRPRIKRLLGNVRVRILGSTVVLLVLVALVSVVVVRQVLLVRLDDRVEGELAQEVNEFRNLANGEDPRTGRPFGLNVRRVFAAYLDSNIPGENEVFLTVPRQGTARYLPPDQASNGGRLLARSPQLDRWRSISDVETGEVETSEGPARFAAVPVTGDGRSLGAFVVAIFTAEERDEIDDAVLIVAAAATGALILGVALAFAISGRVLSPLRGLRDAARSVSGADMRRRIPVEGDDEVAALADTFNEMLDRLEFAFSSQREFIRDVSHELRTPIAVVRGHIELLAEGEVSGKTEHREAMTLVTGELDRMSRFVEDLMLLARAENPDFLQLETVELRGLCEDLIANVAAIAARKWTLDGAPRRSIVADRQRLTQALMNLAQNALAHTQDDDEIAVGSSVNETEATIWIRDTGPGVAPEDQRRIFERFSRGRRSSRRYEGSGLGLAIVRAIAEAHGGRAQLTSRPGAGARFEIVIPVDPEMERVTRELKR